MARKTIEAAQAEAAAPDTSKGTIRFRPDRLLPNALIASIVCTRMEEIDG